MTEEQQAIKNSVNEGVLRVINIEDSEADYHLNLVHLKKGSWSQIESQRVETLEQLREALKNSSWDIVISDFNLPGFGALEALGTVREMAPHTPFILVSGAIGEESTIEIMRAGVDDFIMKSRLLKLVPAIRRAQREFRARINEIRSRRAAQEAIRAREQMLAVVSHDIKNPLSAIQLNTQFLNKMAQEASSLETFRNDVVVQSDKILKVVDRMKNLIRDLLEHNAMDAGGFSVQKKFHDPVHIIEEVIEIFEPMAKEKKITLSARIPSVAEKNHLIPMDRGRIGQVLQNLIGNSLKFTPDEGQIEVGFGLLEGDYECVFWVQDNGPGIKKEDQPLVFDKYWKSVTANPSGTGLGLYICRGIVEAHGGSIGIESHGTSVVGSRFWFRLPRHSTEKATVEAELRKLQIYPTQTEKPRLPVVLIDDNDDMREILMSILEKEGLQAFSFDCPLKALEVLSAGKFKPGLIVLDYNMPEMDGLKFLRMKSQMSEITFRDCPTVLITGDHDIYSEVKSKSLSTYALEKPLDLDYFVNIVRSCILSLPLLDEVDGVALDLENPQKGFDHLQNPN